MPASYDPYVCKKCGKEMWSVTQIVEYLGDIYCKGCSPKSQVVYNSVKDTKMETDSTVIICYNRYCGQKLRVPTLQAEKNLQVTCSKCISTFTFEYGKGDEYKYCPNCKVWIPEPLPSIAGHAYYDEAGECLKCRKCKSPLMDAPPPERESPTTMDSDVGTRQEFTESQSKKEQPAKVGFFGRLFGKGKDTSLDKSKLGEYSLLQLSSPIFRNTPSSSDDNQLVKQAYSLMQDLKWGEARRILQDGLQTLNRKDRLCELIANIYLNEKNPLAIGWYMQSCAIGSPSWVPYLLVSYAAQSLGLDDIAWRCLNTCDVIDTGMKRIDKLETDIARIVENADRSELLVAMKNFEKTMDTYLPLSNELPHDQMERATFLLQNIEEDPEMPPLKQRLKLLRRKLG